MIVWLTGAGWGWMLVAMAEITEATALAEVKRRLMQEFPHVAPADVDAAVAAGHARFENRPIRDFIPLFVEKHARQRLVQLDAAALATSA